MECNITAEVHCHWSDIPPVYRLYVDSDLLTERSFIWPGYQYCVEEAIICNLSDGIHVLKIENCTGNGSFRLKNIKVEGNDIIQHPNYDDTEGQRWTFIVGNRPPPPPYQPVGLDFRVAQNLNK